MIHFQKQTCTCCETVMGVQLLSAPAETENPVCLCNFCVGMFVDNNYIVGLNMQASMWEPMQSAQYLHAHAEFYKWKKPLYPAQQKQELNHD